MELTVLLRSMQYRCFLPFFDVAVLQSVEAQ